MKKHTEWTYRPKYTKARIAKELADKEQELTSTLTDLVRVQTLEGAKMKDIVFECFVQMLEELKLAREQIADCMDGNWDPMDFFFLEIETDDEFDEEELVKQISDSISLTIDHLFYGDKRIGMFVCNAEWNGDSMLRDCEAEDEDEDFSIATETGGGDLTVYAD